MSRYDGSEWTVFTTTDGLAGDDVGAILEDSSGRLWFATDGHGLSRLNPTTGRWRTFTTGEAAVAGRKGLDEIV